MPEPKAANRNKGEYAPHDGEMPKEDLAENSAPKPIVKKMRWPFPIVWIVPICAAVIAGYYFYEKEKDRGPLITIKLANAHGLKAGEGTVQHRGVEIGKIESMHLSDDQKLVVAEVRLHKFATPFMKKGTRFWVVRPEISTQNISGLETITTGPFVDSIPGTGDAQSDFTALSKAPSPLGDGLNVILHAPRLEHLQAQSPVYFRGIQVGVIRNAQVSDSGDGVDVFVTIYHRFSPLVRTRTRFWTLTGADVKGGLLTGVQLKLDSLQALISGGVSFATPGDEKLGDAVTDGAEFALYETPKDEWKDWNPKIQLLDDADGSGSSKDPELPQTTSAVRSAVK